MCPEEEEEYGITAREGLEGCCTRCREPLLREDQMGEKGGEGCVLGKSWGVLRGLAPFGLGEHGCGVVHYNNGAVTSSRLLRFNVTGSRFKFDLSNFFFFFQLFNLRPGKSRLWNVDIFRTFN